MLILLWLVFGGFVGWIASILTSDNNRMGIFANIVVGITGSILGGWLASVLGLGTFAVFSLYGTLIAIGGAVLLLFVLNLLNSKRH